MFVHSPREAWVEVFRNRCIRFIILPPTPRWYSCTGLQDHPPFTPSVRLTPALAASSWQVRTNISIIKFWSCSLETMMFQGPLWCTLAQPGRLACLTCTRQLGLALITHTHRSTTWWEVLVAAGAWSSPEPKSREGTQTRDTTQTTVVSLTRWILICIAGLYSHDSFFATINPIPNLFSCLMFMPMIEI